MTWRCGDVEAWIGRPRTALTDAERLMVEQHLSECEACQRTRDLGDVVSEALRVGSEGLSDATRERALSAAFASAQRRETARVRSLPRVVSWVAAAAIVVLGVRSFVEERAPVARAPVAQVAPSKPEVERSNENDVDWFDVSTDETRAFAHAQVRIRAGSRARFVARSSTLELARGEVSLEVDPRPKRPFAVQTASFLVEVLGTAFTVTPERVDVEHGHVRVVDRDRQPLADLVDGQVYARTAAVTAAAPTPIERAKPIRRESADDLLASARTELARGDWQRAKALVARAEPLARHARQRAELETLRAECALVAGGLTEARQAYERVATRYPQSEAGQNAAFAAAQLALRAHDKKDAKRLLERYLDRYPRGRFVEEARARLHEVGGGPSP